MPKYPPTVVKTVGFAVAAEIHIRLLLSRIHAVASKAGRVATPLLSLNLDFFRRVYIRIDDAAPSNVKRGYAVMPPPSVSSSSSPSPSPVIEWHAKWDGSGATGGGGGSSEPVVAGPMVSGALHDPAYTALLVKALDDHAYKPGMAAATGSDEGHVPFRSFARLKVLLEAAAAEALVSTPLCHAITTQRRVTAFERRRVLELLRAGGSAASLSHVDHQSLSTTAPWPSVISAMDVARQESAAGGGGKAGAGSKRPRSEFADITASLPGVSAAAMAKPRGGGRGSKRGPGVGAGAGLPSSIVNAQRIDSVALRRSLADFFRVSGGGPATGAGAAGGASMGFEEGGGDGDGDGDGGTVGDIGGGGGGDFGDDLAEETAAALRRRESGRCEQVIVVGPGAVEAVKAGVSLANNLPLVNQAAALQEYSSGDDHRHHQAHTTKRARGRSRSGGGSGGGGYGGSKDGDGDGDGRGQGLGLGLDDLRPVEAAESLTEALSILRPFGVLVLRRGRHAPTPPPPPAHKPNSGDGLAGEEAVGKGAGGGGKGSGGAGASSVIVYETISATGALLIGDDAHSAVVVSAPTPPAPRAHGMGKAKARGGKGGKGGAGQSDEEPTTDTFTVATSGVRFVGLVIEAPPAPACGHAVSCNGRKAEGVSLEHCILRGPSTPSTTASSASNGNGSGNFNGQRQKGKPVRTLRGALCASDGATMRLSKCHIWGGGGWGGGGLKLVGAATQSGSGAVTSSANISGAASAAAAAVDKCGVIGGAGVFCVGKAAVEVVESVVEGCTGAGLEARRGGEFFGIDKH